LEFTELKGLRHSTRWT